MPDPWDTSRSINWGVDNITGGFNPSQLPPTILTLVLPGDGHRTTQCGSDLWRQLRSSLGLGAVHVLYNAQEGGGEVGNL